MELDDFNLNEEFIFEIIGQRNFIIVTVFKTLKSIKKRVLSENLFISLNIY